MDTIVRKFNRTVLDEVLEGATGKIIRDEMVDKSRWSITHELIFELEDKTYRTHYRVGATEMQDQDLWDGATEISCTEMEVYEKTITAYRPVRVQL